MRDIYRIMETGMENLEVDDEVSLKTEIKDQTCDNGTKEGGELSEIELFSMKSNEFSSVLSKRIEQIDKLLVKNGDIDEIKIRKDQLESKFNSIKRERDKLFELNIRDSKNLFKFEWIEDLEALIDETNINILVYFKRKNDLENKTPEHLPTEGGFVV